MRMMRNDENQHRTFEPPQFSHSKSTAEPKSEESSSQIPFKTVRTSDAGVGAKFRPSVKKEKVWNCWKFQAQFCAILGTSIMKLSQSWRLANNVRKLLSDSAKMPRIKWTLITLSRKSCMISSFIDRTTF